MRGAWGAIVALALVGGLVGSPAAAEPNAARPQAKQSATDPVAELVTMALSDNPGSAIPKIEAMLAQADEKSDRAFLLALRGAAYLGTGKTDLAARDFDESRRLLPDTSMVDRIRFIAGLAHERYDQSSIALDQLLTGSTASVMEIDLDLMWTYLRNDKVEKARLDDQRVALARLDYGGADGTSIRSAAVRILLVRGKIAEATALAPKIDDLDDVQSALIDRRMEPLWPTFERNAGPKMANLVAKNLAGVEADFANMPSKASNRRRLMSAYVNANRRDDALMRGAEIGRTPEALASLDEEDGWVVNQHAMALFRGGRPDDADRRYADLIAANSEKGWIVNMAINRLELLTMVGKYDAADKLMAYTEATGKRFGSPYAQQLIRHMKLCIAIGLKRDPRVSALLTDLRKFAKDAPTATIEGLMCAGDIAGATKIVLDSLADDEKQNEFIKLLQRRQFVPDDPSLWSDYWLKLRDQPGVEAAFQKVGRDLPATFHIK